LVAPGRVGQMSMSDILEEMIPDEKGAEIERGIEGTEIGEEIGLGHVTGREEAVVVIADVTEAGTGRDPEVEIESEARGPEAAAETGREDVKDARREKVAGMTSASRRSQRTRATTTSTATTTTTRESTSSRRRWRMRMVRLEVTRVMVRSMTLDTRHHHINLHQIIMIFYFKVIVFLGLKFEFIYLCVHLTHK